MNQKLLGIITLFLLILIILPPLSGTSVNRNRLISLDIHIGVTNERFFLWSQPSSPAPSDGYPIILVFHGAAQHAFSWFINWNQWNRNQQSFTCDAVEKGFFIVALESQRPLRPGPRAWDVFESDPDENDDIRYIQSVLNWLNSSSYALDLDNLFCTGFSSGAFMCSRLALSQEDMFNAIAVNSGCNADSINLTSRGPVFDLTTSYQLSAHHPPTLILHGEQDSIVPLTCGLNYVSDLQKADIPTSFLSDPDKGHIWLQEYNQNILDWFTYYMV